MMSLILGIFIAAGAIVAVKLVSFGTVYDVNTRQRVKHPADKIKNIVASVALIIGILVSLSGGFAYNDAGWSQHVRTAYGSERAIHDTGWYFEGWGISTAWPDFITVSYSDMVGSRSASRLSPRTIVMKDGWSGNISLTARFSIPQDKVGFINVARTFGTPEQLTTSSLIPSINSALDHTSSMFTMNEYFTNGSRHEFKTEFTKSITEGQAALTIEVNQDADGTASKYNVIKVLDGEGDPLRTPYEYMQFGVTPTSVLIETLRPERLYEEQTATRRYNTTSNN